MCGRWLAATLLWLACALPAAAQTRAWLDRPEVTLGETTTLNIETHLAVDQVDLSPLRRQFDLAGQTVRRNFVQANGRQHTRTVFAVGIRPRAQGVFSVPALRVGSETTQPQRLVVLPPSVIAAGARADAFVETQVDAYQPYVQQAVGVVVRLHYAVPLLSGQLDQAPPDGAALQRVGEDLTYQRELGGRRYNVVERRYLLLPERSGALVLPGARFNGQAVGGFLDDLFGDGRKPLAAAAPAQRLQVLPVPADAPQPWLPLRDLRLRWVQAPTRAQVGEATTLEVELVADGASAAQLPALELQETGTTQVFAEPVQADERFVDGRPQTVLRRRIAVVPQAAGALAVQGPRIEWWDAVNRVARTASVPPLRLQVAPGQAMDADATGGQPPSAAASADAARERRLPAGGGWLAAGVLALLVLCAAVVARRRRAPVDAASPAAPAVPSLAHALAAGDLAAIAAALPHACGMPHASLDAVSSALEEAAQRDAVQALQSARWGEGDPDAALRQLRAAFPRGPTRRHARRSHDVPLPPLYPER